MGLFRHLLRRLGAQIEIIALVVIYCLAWLFGIIAIFRWLAT